MPRVRPSEHAFRMTADAIDRLPPGQEAAFLARLVLILAEEMADPPRFEGAVNRAFAPAEPRT